MLEEKDLEIIRVVIKDSVDSSVNVAVNSAVNDAVDRTVKAAVDVAVNDAVDRTVKAAVDSAMNDALKPIKKDLRALQLTVENEVLGNIRVIAEGHLDLNRKLDEALKITNEKEILSLRVNYLESEVKKIKERIEDIA